MLRIHGRHGDGRRNSPRSGSDRYGALPIDDLLLIANMELLVNKTIRSYEYKNGEAKYGPSLFDELVNGLERVGQAIDKMSEDARRITGFLKDFANEAKEILTHEEHNEDCSCYGAVNS